MGKFDTRMKEFWRDNGHFADLFNAVVFQGREILKPEMLSEKDTDESAEVQSRKIYRKTVDETFRDIRKDLASVVGVIVGSESIEKLADSSEEGGIDLCRALSEMMQEKEDEGRRKGRREGRLEGELRGRILVYREYKLSPEQIAEKLNISVVEVEALCHEENTPECILNFGS